MPILDPSALAIAPISDAPAQELAWFAIRQPAVVRFLERRLWSPDGDAFAVALDGACRLHAAVTLSSGLEPVRIDDRLLREGLDMTPPPSLVAWVAGRCDEAPVVLTGAEEDAIARALAAVAWAFTTGRSAAVVDRILG